jgi:ribosomal protein L22
MDKMPKKVQKEPEPDGMARGTPSEESIFARDNEGVPEEEQVEPAEKPLYEEIDPDALMNVLDPEPAKRLAWQRKKVIQQIRKRGELTKDEIIKRTERECQVGSAMFKVSTKKLVHLARQIAGKPIGEAIVQMQLSKKRAAQDVMKHLEYAKNLAIVSRGMGLGQAEGRQGEPLDIELKDGKRKRITDQTGIYVDQAWVNKGDETVTPDYRGRGRIFGHRHRTASKFL